MEIRSNKSFTGWLSTSMISFLSPLWFLLLVLIALIYWLHHYATHSATFYTSSLFVWKKITPETGQKGLTGKVDRRWLLRALISLLLILTLTEPVIQHSKAHSYDVWIDDSLSMFTQQGESNRIQIAMQQLLEFLKQQDAAKVRLHSLGNPAMSISFNTADGPGWHTRLSDWIQQPRAEPSLPPVTSLSNDNTHILITDGADRSVNAWSRKISPRHIFQVGSTASNIALTLLSLRKLMKEPGTLKGITRIDNFSDSPQQVRQLLLQQGRTINTRLVDVPASAHAMTSFSIPSQHESYLQARIEASDDALALDNSLQLDLKNLRGQIHYQLQHTCSFYLQLFLNSQPDLIKTDRQPDLLINCDPAQSQNSALPTLNFYSDTTGNRTTQTAHWHNNLSSESLHFSAGLLYSDRAPLLTSDNSPLLSADGRQLISTPQDSPDTINSYLDINDKNLVLQAEFPLLISRLINRLTQSTQEFSPISVNHDPDASRITPLSLSVTSSSTDQFSVLSTSLAPYLLITSLLLLLLDASISGGLIPRQGRHNS